MRLGLFNKTSRRAPRANYHLGSLPAYSPKNTKAVPAHMRPTDNGAPICPVRFKTQTEPHHDETGQCYDVHAEQNVLGEHRAPWSDRVWVLHFAIRELQPIRSPGPTEDCNDCCSRRIGRSGITSRPDRPPTISLIRSHTCSTPRQLTWRRSLRGPWLQICCSDSEKSTRSRATAGFGQAGVSINGTAGGDRPELLDVVVADADVPVVKVDGRVAVAGISRILSPSRLVAADRASLPCSSEVRS